MKLYSIDICGHLLYFTLSELKWILTREAYDLYFHALRQKGSISFGRGAMCTTEFIKQLFT